MIMDKLMNYNNAVNYIDKNGWDDFLELLQKEFPERKLYTVSISWYHDRQYICKAKDIYGDVIIDWE